VPDAPVVHTDDPGWRVGGAPAALLACATAGATVDHLRPRQRPAEVQEGLPTDDAGVRVTERGRSDDAQTWAGVPPPQGLAHLPRASSDVLETTTGRARAVGEQLKRLRQEAMERGPASRDGQRTADKADAEALQAERPAPLRDRPLKDPDHHRRLHERGGHHDRGNLGRCLADPRVEPTNKRAERAWRPAVIGRKGSPGAKNDRGAGAFAVFTRVSRTLLNTQAGAVVETLSPLLRPPQPQHVQT
jgi:Transposase IS66 family